MSAELKLYPGLIVVNPVITLFGVNFSVEIIASTFALTSTFKTV